VGIPVKNLIKTWKDWTVADKINSVIAATALFAALIALVPYAKQVIHSIWQTSNGTISYISPAPIGDSNRQWECSIRVSVGGAAYHIPDNMDLWLVAHSDATGLWYLISKVPPGNWSEAPAISSALRVSAFQLIMVSNTDDGSFVDYWKDSVDGRFYHIKPFDHLPPNQTLSTRLVGDSLNACLPEPVTVPTP
jgi:hypothetical protein